MTKSADKQQEAEARGTTPIVPRHAGLIAIGVHALVTLVLGWPALAGKLLLNPASDQYIAGYAFRDFARKQFLATGAIPQWNPYLYGGMPFVDAMHGDTFYPTALLRLLIGTGSGMTWGLIIHVSLAGCFTYLFLRGMRLSFIAALAGGVAYQLGGNVAGLVSPGHDGKLFIAALLPLALYLVTRGIRDAKPWAWGPLAIVIGLAVLSPHPQLLQYMLLLTGAFALVVAHGSLSEAPDIPGGDLAAARRLAFALGAVALGMVMGAIQFYPVTKYTAWSPRAGGITWEAATSYSLPPEEIVNFALPQFSGILDAYWGRNGIHLHSEYMGVAVLVLAVLAIGTLATQSHRRLRWFFLATFVVSLLWALGGNTPFYRLVYAIVPGTKFFRAPSTMLFIVAFSVAVMAALGVERLIRVGIGRGPLLAAAAAIVLLALLGMTGSLTNSGLAIQPDFPDGVLANEPALKSGAARMLLFGLLACGVAFLTGSRRVSRDLGGAILVALIATDLWTVVRLYWQFSAPARELYASNAIIDFLHREPGPFRVATLRPTRGNPHDNILFGDGLMSHGVLNTMGYHGNHIGNYDLLTGASERFKNLGNPNFWRLANVRYFITDQAEFPIEGSKVVQGPVKDTDGNELYLHSLPVDATYAWVTPVIVKASEQAAAGAALDPRFDVRRAALFDSSSAVPNTQVDSLPAPLSIKARVLDYQPGKVSIELDAPAPRNSALVVSENYYPGWHASADGKDAVVGIADVSLIGVALPEGARKIELAFINAPYRTGRTVTWIAVVLALVLWVAGALAARRQAASG